MDLMSKQKRGKINECNNTRKDRREKRILRKTTKGDVYSYILDNGKGLKAEILNLGGIVRRLIFDGVDVVLGRDDYQKYLSDGSFFGATIGRNSNRIEDCHFEINGKEYKVAANDNGRNNNLHGGKGGFNTKFWDVEENDGKEPSVVLKTVSKDGEEGFPANAYVTVTFTLTAENSLKIHYEGTADGDTLMNLTNHSYFNLNGHTSGDIKNHILWLDCDFYTPITKNLVPDGSVLSVLGTAFDFTVPKTIGRDLEDDDIQMTLEAGYDHNMVIKGRGFRKFAVLEGDKSGIVMEAFK